MLHILFADGTLLRKAVELRAEDGSLKFPQTIIEADDSVVKLIRKAGAPGIDIALDEFHILKIVGDDGAAFSRRNQLTRLKAERAEIANGASAFPLPHAAMRMRAIFNNFQIMFFGDAHDFVDIGEAHTEVDGENSFSLRSDRFLNQLRIQTISIGIDVHEDWNCVHQENGADRPFPGVSGDDNFVSGLNAHGN